MNRLAERIRRLIEADGPLGVDRYMSLCLYDPEDGYYTTREPFGAAGDFTTAPEISQMFGELVAAWLVLAWRALGVPDRVTLAEIGPGRGTLMADIVRTLRRLAPDLVQDAGIVMIEVSPRLQAIQRETLSAAGIDAVWMDAPDHLSRPTTGPLLVVGNEFFDALPFRQFVGTESGYREQVVLLDQQGELAFGLGATTLPFASASPGASAEVVELSPMRSALMETLAEALAARGGAALFIDYGYLGPATGDTFQALRRHAYVSPLEAPGEADLTSHVDFAPLRDVALGKGLAAEVMTQGDFLLRLGLLERAGRLGAAEDEAGREAIRAAVERLAGPDQMGRLFKVLGVVAGADLPAPFPRSPVARPASD